MSSQVTLLTQKGIDKHIWNSYGETPPMWSYLFHYMETEFRYIDMVNWQDYNLPGFRQPGGPTTAGQFLPSFSVRMVIRNASLADGLAYEDIRDDIYGFIHRMLPKKGTAMGLAFQTLMEVCLAQYMVYNGYTAGAITGMVDGVSLFNTAHPVSLSNQAQTFSNRSDVDLSISSAQASITRLETTQAENNIRYQGNRVAECWVNPALQFIARQIFEQPGNQAFGADYTPNKHLYEKKVKVMDWPYFKSYGVNGTIANNPNSWFLKGEKHEGYFYNRQQFEVFSDFDMDTLSQVWAATSRFGYVTANPRGWDGSLGG